jgi:hypothetical protein
MMLWGFQAAVEEKEGLETAGSCRGTGALWNLKIPPKHRVHLRDVC